MTGNQHICFSCPLDWQHPSCSRCAHPDNGWIYQLTFAVRLWVLTKQRNGLNCSVHVQSRPNTGSVTEGSTLRTFCQVGSFRLCCLSSLLSKYPYVHLAFMGRCKFSFMAVAESLLILISPVKPQIYCQQKPFYCPKLAAVANYCLKRENYLTAAVKGIDCVVV